MIPETYIVTKYMTSVDSLAEAWAFVMAHLDEAGAEPEIRIRPRRDFTFDQIATGEGEGRLRFGVVVTGSRTIAESGDGS